MRKIISLFAFSFLLTSAALYGEVVVSNPQIPSAQPNQTNTPSTYVNPNFNNQVNNRFGAVNPSDRFNQGLNNNLNTAIPNSDANMSNYSSQTTPSGMYATTPK